MTTSSPIKVTVIRRFNAAPERVFDAWLDPEMLAQWMFGPAVRDEEIARLTAAAHIGGCFSCRDPFQSFGKQQPTVNG